MKRGIILLAIIAVIFLIGCLSQRAGFVSTIGYCMDKRNDMSYYRDAYDIGWQEGWLTINHKIHHLCGLDLHVDTFRQGREIVVIEKLGGISEGCICHSKIQITGPLEKNKIYRLSVYKEQKGLRDLLFTKEIDLIKELKTVQINQANDS